jgi:hypothetical protein
MIPSIWSYRLHFSSLLCVLHATLISSCLTPHCVIFSVVFLLPVSWVPSVSSSVAVQRPTDIHEICRTISNSFYKEFSLLSSRNSCCQCTRLAHCSDLPRRWAILLIKIQIPVLTQVYIFWHKKNRRFLKKFVGKPEGKIPLRRPKRKWKDFLRYILGK